VSMSTERVVIDFEGGRSNQRFPSTAALAGLLHGWFFQRRVHGSLHRVSRRSVLVLLDEVLCSGGGKERFQIGGVGGNRTQRSPA
jgi:hypothetical protein